MPRRLNSLTFGCRLAEHFASWAVPKGPPEEIGEKRLAIHVGDHPLEYAKFVRGDIPAGNYGAGHVDIWDPGTFRVEWGRFSAAEQIEKREIKSPAAGQAPERHICAGEDAARFPWQRMAVHSQNRFRTARRSRNHRNAVGKQRQMALIILYLMLRTWTGQKKVRCRPNISVALAQHF